MRSLMRGIAAVKPGATTGDIGHAIQSYAEGEDAARWCAISAAMAWASVFHALPNIVHYGRAGEGAALKPGMFFTIEPMINLGGLCVKMLSDGWTAVTRDRSLSAQFEHSVGVTETGCRDFHPVAQGLGQTALCLGPDRMARAFAEQTRKPHHLGHRERLRERFRRRRRRRAARL